jgi:hypothetical protein
MFGQAGAMQLSAANLLIASQQIARGVQQPSPDAQAKFAAALAKEKTAPGAAAFEPLEFTKAATPPSSAPAPSATPAASTPATAYGRASPLGANIDIRV